MPGRLFALPAVAAVALAGCGSEPGFSGQAPPGEIAFSFGGRIHVMGPDGSGVVRLTGGAAAGEAVEDNLPTWSPDGRTLAFVRQSKRRDETRLRVHLIERDGGPSRRLATTGDVAWPAWSPDGGRIAFVRFTEGDDFYKTALVVADADGGNERVLRRVRADNDEIRLLGEPAWSPDRTRIAYTRTILGRKGTFRPSLYVIGVGGGQPQLLARGGDTAAWSPDGGRIAFASIRDRNGKNCYETCLISPELYVMDADGSDPVRLTRNRGRDSSPSWSPDGRRIAFASDRNYPSTERTEIYSIGADGSCLTWLTNGSPESAYPSWRPGIADSAPGSCGATRRPPVVEVDLGRIRAPRDAPVYWLGQRFGSMLLGPPRAPLSTTTAPATARVTAGHQSRSGRSPCAPGAAARPHWDGGSLPPGGCCSSTPAATG